MEGNLLQIADIDVFHGTPALDVKPCVPEFDERSDVRVGWLTRANDRVRTERSDDRFR